MMDNIKAAEELSELNKKHLKSRRWTREKPTELGWYWRRRHGMNNNLHIVLISYEFLGDTTPVREDRLEAKDGIPADEHDEWAGPLIPPEEEKSECR